MQITNSLVCGTSKGCIYKQIKPPLVREHGFPLTGFVCMEAHVTLVSNENAPPTKMTITFLGHKIIFL